MSDNPNIIHGEDEEFDNEPCGLGKLFFHKMKENGTSIAQIDAITGERDSFQSLFVRSVRTAIVMRRCGLKKGQNVIISDYNHLELNVPLIGALFLGATVSAIDPMLSLSETKHLLQQLKSKIIFTSCKFEKSFVEAVKSANLETRIVVFGKSAFQNFNYRDTFLCEDDEEHDFVPVEIADIEKETAFIICSSGSTGFSKGILLSHYAMNRQLSSYKDRYRPFSNLLAFSSLHWLSKLMFVCTGIFYNSSLVQMPEFEESVTCKTISECRVTTILLSPNYAMRLIKSTFLEACDTSSVKLIIIAGNKITERLLIGVEKMFLNAKVIQCWGMTETATRGISHGSNALDLIPPQKRYASLGRPSKGVSYKIVDPDTGKALGPNQPGELRVKSKVQMIGYVGMDSSNVWDEDGYLKTGDMMYYDEDRYFYYVERMGEMFKYRSEYVYPNVIENVLLAHPSVKSAVVVGLGHPDDENWAAAAVTLVENCKNFDEEELRKFAESDSQVRVPLLGGVTVFDQLPEATSGKIKRKLVKELLSKRKVEYTIGARTLPGL